MMLEKLRKDCRVLWRGILLVALAQAASTGLWAYHGPLIYLGKAAPAAWTASIAALAGMLLLTIRAMHRGSAARTDSAGSTPDCSVLGTHLLFTLFVVQGPMLIADTVEGLMLGFPPLAVAGAAGLRWLNMAMFVSLPMVVIAAVMPSFLATVVAGIAWFVALEAGVMFLGGVDLNPVAFDWIDLAFRGAVFVPGAVLALILRYGAQRTWMARAALLITLLLMVTPLLPWQARSDIQHRLTSRPNSLPTLELASDAASQLRQVAGSDKSSLSLEVPLLVTRLPRNSLLLFDSIHVRLVNSSGDTVYENHDGTRNIVIEGYIEAGPGTAPLPQTTGLSVPPDPRRYGDGQVLRMEISYALTLAQPAETQTVMPEISLRYLQRAGWCKSLVFDYGRGPQVDLGCLTTIRPPVCIRAPQLGGQIQCAPDYAPLALRRWPLPDIIERSNLSEAGAGLAVFRVQSRTAVPVTLTTYYAAAHFTRTVVLPQVTVRYLPAAP